MAQALGLPAMLPEASALGAAWTLDGDHARSSALNVAYCENVVEDENQRLAGVSRTFVTGQGDAQVRATAYVGAYRTAAGARLVLAALRTCSVSGRTVPQTVSTGPDRVTRCSPDRVLCFTIRVVNNKIAGAQAQGPIGSAALATASVRLADLVAVRVPH